MHLKISTLHVDKVLKKVLSKNGKAVIAFHKAKDILIICFKNFKLSVMQQASGTSERILIMGGKCYLANTQDQDETQPRLLIHA